MPGLLIRSVAPLALAGPAGAWSGVAYGRCQEETVFPPDRPVAFRLQTWKAW